MFHRALVTGEVSMYKLARATSVVTHENEEELMSQVRILSRRGLDQLVRDMKSEMEEKIEVTPRLVFGEDFVNNSSGKSLSGQGVYNKLELREDVQERLLELENKGLNINDILMEMMDQRERDIREKKEMLAKEAEENGKQGRPVTRHIPAKIRTLLQKEYGTKCAIAKCERQSTNIHHAARFSITRNHNPLLLAPLCKQHHEVAHAVDTRVQEEKWRHRNR